MDIAVVGLGLIGGSVLRALAAAGHTLRGYDSDPATRATARTAAAQARPGGRWRVAGEIGEAVAGAELVVVAVPLPAVAEVLDQLVAAGYAGLVTDVTSVKAPVRELVAARLDRPHARLAGYVGGHPMTGSETAGFTSADPSLLTGCAWVLCLEPETSLADWLTLADLVTRLGARVVPTTSADHDAAVAAVSHVPHLLAAALAGSVAGDPLALTLAAGSFRDGTRVAASPPDLVAAMCAGNPAAAPALAAVTAALADAAAALASSHPFPALRSWLTPAAAVRAGWPPAPGARLDLPATPDALLRLGRAGGWVTTVAPDRRTVHATRPPPA
ncbi:MAG: prephenate dehydrogenase/arogenate dehydrogenase family protein [Micromonosporaceae bacterium]|nr:prephenate dehydrogenase/arogenate dehydrogenase family protein [Micromonosporaceae bacterium]